MERVTRFISQVISTIIGLCLLFIAIKSLMYMANNNFEHFPSTHLIVNYFKECLTIISNIVKEIVSVIHSMTKG